MMDSYEERLLAALGDGEWRGLTHLWRAVGGTAHRCLDTLTSVADHGLVTVRRAGGGWTQVRRATDRRPSTASLLPARLAMAKGDLAGRPLVEMVLQDDRVAFLVDRHMEQVRSREAPGRLLGVLRRRTPGALFDATAGLAPGERRLVLGLTVGAGPEAPVARLRLRAVPAGTLLRPRDEDRLTVEHQLDPGGLGDEPAVTAMRFVETCRSLLREQCRYPWDDDQHTRRAST